MKRTALALTLILALLFSAVAGTQFVNLAGANPDPWNYPEPPSSLLFVYIRNNGSLDSFYIRDCNHVPALAPIQRVGNVYTLTDNLVNSLITVECDNIVVDGKGFTLQGLSSHSGPAIFVQYRSNVTIKNIEIKQSLMGVWLEQSANCTITRNRIYSSPAIKLRSSLNNQIFENNITTSATGVEFDDYFGISGEYKPSEGNTFYRNNLINNSQNVVFVSFSGKNKWDNGKEGNFWSDYNGTDGNMDGIGDTPYVINLINGARGDIDNYPLMAPAESINELPQPNPSLPDVEAEPIRILSPQNQTYTTTDIALNFTASKSAEWMRYSLDAQDNVTIYGNITLTGLSDGDHNVTVYATDEAGNTGASETLYFNVDTPEPFSIATAATAAGASVTIIGVGLLVYFKKRKHQTEMVESK